MGQKQQGNGKAPRDAVLQLYTQGLTNKEIGRRLGVSRQRIDFLIRYQYKFLPQSRYMLEGALCRDWMLRHRPKEYRQIVAQIAAEQDTQSKGE